MKTRTVAASAWLRHHLGPEDLRADDARFVFAISLFDADTDMSSHGYTFVGPARITVDLPDEQSLIDNKVESLRAEKQRTLAVAQAKATEIEVQIQTLLAITYEPEGA